MDDYDGYTDEGGEYDKNTPYGQNGYFGKKDIRPGFLGRSKDEEQSGKNTLKSAENSATSGAKKAASGVASKAASALGIPGAGLFTGGKGKSSLKGVKIGKGKMLAGGAILMCLLVFGVMFAVVGGPNFVIGTLDSNMKYQLFGEMDEALKEQTESYTQQALKSGKFPEAYSADLATHGIDVGQVTASGEFVKTNTYIAELGSSEVAANGDFQVHDDGSGALAIMYDGQIITADNFLAALDSNPWLYVAYEEATDITARFYYSEDVDEVFQEMGISRNNFHNWEATEDTTENQQQFNDLLADTLDSDSDLTVAGYNDDEKDGQKIVIRSGDNAEEKVKETADKIKDSNTDVATTKAAQLLNSAISSNEPYKAARAFVAIDEPLERVKVGDNGPANELLNVLSTETEVTYDDVNTNEKTTKKASILSTPNYAALVAQGTFSKSEANNFSRDRVLVATDTADGNTIKKTTVSTESSKKSGTVLAIGSTAGASNDVLQKAKDSVALAATENVSETFTSVVGGNRIVEGGAFLADTIGKRTLGEMPSDQATTVASWRHAEERLAKKAEAERATKSPFDISSPYTFMGSIARSMAQSYIRNMANSGGGTVLGSAVGAMSSVTSSAIKNLTSGAIADGENDTAYATTFGDCQTPENANNASGDLYCNDGGTFTTKYTGNDKVAWDVALGDNLEDGKIKEGSDLANYITLATERQATVGVQSADVCEAYKDINPDLFQDVGDAISGFFGLYQSCDGVDEDIANGGAYTLSSANANSDQVELFSGYMLYDTVSSLLGEKESSVSIYRREYYAKHPKDTSAVAVIARRSGMSKAEAQIALEYSAELTRIAQYDPSTRYAFGKPVFETKKKDALIEYSEDVQVSLYCIWAGKTEYADVRNRSFAA